MKLRPLFASLFAAALFSQSAAAQTPIKLGWVGPLTGSAAVLGVDSAAAARLAVEEINKAGGIGGRQAELLTEDDQYDTAKAVTAYSKLASEGVAGILTPTYGAPFALADRSKRDGVIIIDPLDCNSDIAALGGNIFCIATETESVARVLLESIRARKESPAVVLYDETNPFMVLVNKIFEKEGKDVISLSIPIAPGSADFRTVVLKAKTRNPRSLVILGHEPFGKAMVEARNLKMSAQFYSVGTILSPGFQMIAGNALNGTLFAYWEAPHGAAYEDFMSRFKAAAGRDPILELATIPSYDSAKLLMQALKECAPNISAECIDKSLLKTKDYRGLSGNLTMDPDHAVRSIKESIYKFDGGTITKQ